MIKRARRSLGVIMVALLGMLLFVEASGPAVRAQDSTAPYRVGYVSADTTSLEAAAPGARGAVPALPAAVPSSVDADASSGGNPRQGTAGLVWVSKRADAPGAAKRTGDLWYLADGASSAVRLTTDDAEDEDPALSPDGQWVAFASDRAGNLDIWVIKIDGTDARRITDSPAADTWPSWSPDGSTLAFSSTRDDSAGDLYTVPVAGGTPSRLTADPATDTQPAWSPSGNGIAFTTTRFRPEGDVVLLPADGGPVNRVVPDPWDSTEPAWSPDGTHLAFTTRRDDPDGDVYEVALATDDITPVASDPHAGETHPTWRHPEEQVNPEPVIPATGEDGTGTVIFTRLHRGDTSDIWSADSTGQDRRDHTDRPDASETDPAYSTDGTQLAYTEFSWIGRTGSRVMVADAEGRGPRPLTADLAAGESQQDPAWSPDGTMIALTDVRQGGRGAVSSVRIIRVADGLVLGTIPMPEPLTGSDIEPAWSPDGSRIALVRRASRTDKPSNVTPSSVDRVIRRGGAFAIDKVVRTPQIPANPDIVLLIDGTGSMEQVIRKARENLLTVVRQVRDTQPSAHFGVAVYRDTKYDDPDRAFRVEMQPGTAATEQGLRELERALKRIDAFGGGDTPEDWINALYRVGTGDVAFRAASSKVVVLVGDASSHDPSNGHDLASAIDALNRKHVRVVAVPVGGDVVPVGGVTDGLNAAGQAKRVADGSRGVLMPPTPDTGRVADAIVTGLARLPVTITPTVTRCDAGLSVTLQRVSARVPGGRNARFTETVRAGNDAPPGATLRCAVQFRVSGEKTARPGYTEHITVRVTDADAPVMVVDDVTVDATGPDGAVINYRARATDASGAPLPARCKALSGSRFPIGATTVTCTATDAAGHTGSDTATMTVVGANSGSSRRIWLVNLSRPTPEEIQVTDQVDLSARLGEPCAGGTDGAPAWSPDGRALAFEHGHGICAADANGKNARWAVQSEKYGGALLDPAWSPDGAFVAFADDPGDWGNPRIRTVPVAGGESSTLIKSPGGAEQPVFRRMPDLVVTGAAAPPSIPFEGRTTLEFTVTNRGIGAAPNTELSASLPTGLRREDVQTTRGNCVPTELRCSLGSVAAGETVTVRIVATGVSTGRQVAQAAVSTGLPETNAADNETTAVVVVTPAAGSLSVATDVMPQPAYVGGDDMVVSYTVHNSASVPMPDVKLTTTLPGSLPQPKEVSPGACRADGTGCDLGDLQAGQSVEVRFSFAANTATDGTASATVTSRGPDSDPTDNTATTPVVVRQPALTVDPTVGPPGFVTRVVGSDFPPGAQIRLSWSVGISETPGEVMVRADGTIETQALIFHHDRLGYRQLRGTSVSGPKFGDVSSPPFLVVPREVQPPFVTRH